MSQIYKDIDIENQDDLELKGDLVNDCFIETVRPNDLPLNIRKYMIEQRYKRLHNKRHIGTEYVEPQEIRETFAVYLNQESVLEWYRKTDKEILDWFEQWILCLGDKK
jgi:hypothetical protein